MGRRGGGGRGVDASVTRKLLVARRGARGDTGIQTTEDGKRSDTLRPATSNKTCAEDDYDNCSAVSGRCLQRANITGRSRET